MHQVIIDVAVRFLSSHVAHSRYPFSFQAAEHTFHRRIVPTVPTTAHALAHAITPEPLTKLAAAILRALIRVKQKPLRPATLFVSHVQRLDDQIRICEEVSRYSQHDRLVRMKVSPQARKRNPALPSHWEVREVSYEIQGKVKTVMTSLPVDTYNAKAVAKLYQERWEIELGFRDIKSSMQQNAMTLRSKKVELIYQEVWGLLLAYNVIRREASQAAVAFGRAPSDIRFKPACQYIAVQLIVMAAANPISATGRRLAELRAGIGGLFLDHRPRPSRPRTVKISKTRFPVDRKAAPLK